VTEELISIWGMLDPWVKVSEFKSMICALCGAAPAHDSS
jgi:hypothetical protein